MAASSALPPANPSAAGPRIRRWAAIWVTVVLGIATVGTLGYVVLFGWSVSDAFYMTVITLTTEGYREVRDLDDGGRIWTMLVAVAGVGIIFGTVGFVAETFVAEALSGRRQRRRMAKTVAELRDHFILCGYGRVGSTVARELENAGQPVVVIDSVAASTDLAAREGHLVVEGDATRDDVLVAAGITRAKALITTVDTDATNVYVTLSARALNPKLFIVARANEETSESKLRQAGADRAVSPYTRAGRQIAELATRPRVADFIDFALSRGQLSFTIEEIEVAADGPLAGRTVADMANRGIHVMAIVTHGPRQFETSAPMDRVLALGDQLIVSGTAEVLTALRAEV
ncbi:MAG TPA: potassium channel protein [Candidatus Limnocylindria bacterium]|nr:potassium channel protein [Candidatus Limnocylindria bacterium]